jgi:hypothetical protein
MDIKSLRAPTFSVHELSLARASTLARQPRLVYGPAPTRTLEPVARTELWETLYARALYDKHPEPEKFADAAVRARETALRKREERAHVQLVQEPPKPVPVNEAAAPSRSKARSNGPKCQAKTLEGRQCGFAATCGPFCKKHAPKKPL